MKRSLLMLGPPARLLNQRIHSVRRPRRSGLVLMEAADQSRFARHFELAATILLATAAVATAWSAYQAARWRGEQAKARGRSIAARVESTRAANVANRQGQIDVALFTQWVDAYARHETELERFYRKRFRPEFQPAFTGVGRDQAAQEPRGTAVPVRDAAVQARGRREGRPARGAGRRVLPARRAS